MKKVLAIMSALLGASAAAQEADDALRAAMYLCGAASEDQTDSYLVERLESMSPVKVNSPGRKASILLSSYQLAALADYRSRFGDILSFEELALVDGFTPEAVRALKPFLSLESSRIAGSTDTARVHVQAIGRLTSKNLGGKLKAGSDSWEVCGAIRGKEWTASASAAVGRWAVVAGDYNLRFGQGVAQWSGFSIETLSGSSSFMKKPSGVTPLWSYLPSEHRGIALAYSPGRWNACTFATLGKTFGAHGEYLSMKGNGGVTILAERGVWTVSADGRYTLGPAGIIAFEAAFRGRSPAGKLVWKGDFGPWSFAFQGRWLPTAFTGKKSGDYAAAICAEWSSGYGARSHQLALSLDFSLHPRPSADVNRRQVRVYGQWLWNISSSWDLQARFTGRYRNYEDSRSDVRVDLKYSCGGWGSTLKAEYCHCGGDGVLGYWEGKMEWRGFAFYPAVTVYSTSGWSSRIYAWQRDAPGSFSVPAFYGRGCRLSAFTSYKKSFRPFSLKLYGGLALTHFKPLAYVYHVTFQVVPRL